MCVISVHIMELILKSMVEKLRDFYDFLIIECILRI